MTDLIQIRRFDARKMTHKNGYALTNVRIGFGIAIGSYQSCKADLEVQLRQGTAHAIETIPKGVSVPIYALAKWRKYRTVSRRNGFAFVITADGRIYADGKRKSKKWLEDLAKNNNLYWAERCDGNEIVRRTKC